MRCEECRYAARVYNGQNLKNSRYTYCSLRPSGSYKNGNFKADGWTKVLKTSEPKWCPLKNDIYTLQPDEIKFGFTQRK